MNKNRREIFKFLVLPTEIWVKRQKGVETNTLIFCKPLSNCVSPVSSFSTLPKRHQVIPSWSRVTLFKLWCVMRCQAVERYAPLVFCMGNIPSILYLLPCANTRKACCSPSGFHLWGIQPCLSGSWKLLLHLLRLHRLYPHMGQDDEG